MSTLTHAEAMDAANEFIRVIIRRNRPWNSDILSSYLPKGYVLREGAEYTGPCTRATLAAFLCAEAIPV